MRALALALLLLAAPAAAQDRPRFLDTHVGDWSGESQGWRVSLTVNATPLTPERGTGRLRLTCEATGAVFESDIMLWDGNRADALFERPGLIVRIFGTLPRLRVAMARGRMDCPPSAIELERRG